MFGLMPAGVSLPRGARPRGGGCSFTCDRFHPRQKELIVSVNKKMTNLRGENVKNKC